MAGQAPNRREVLQALAYAALAGGAPGFCHWTYAFADPPPPQTHQHLPPQPPGHAHAAVYKPRFFTPPEYATVVQLAELILPRTPAIPSSATHRLATSAHPATPHPARINPAEAGATDAGTAEFIDFMVAEDPALQSVFREGLAWLNTASSAHAFNAMSSAEQTSVLERIAYKKNFRAEDKVGQAFFSAMRRLTVMGFYTSRIGLESLDFPGLRFYAGSPAVPQDGSLESLGVSR